MPINYDTHPITHGARMESLGAFVTRGGVITLDQYLPNDEIFKALSCDVGGIVVVEGIDGNTYPFNLQDNGGAPLVGRRVVTTDGTSTTTATGIKWSGGL